MSPVRVGGAVSRWTQCLVSPSLRMGMAVFRDGSELPSEEVTGGGGPRGKPGIQCGAPLPPYPSLHVI